MLAALETAFTFRHLSGNNRFLLREGWQGKVRRTIVARPAARGAP